MSTELYNPKMKTSIRMMDLLSDIDSRGGLCRFIIEDRNIYEDVITKTIKWCEDEENKNRVDKELCIAICEILLQLTFIQRALVLDMFYAGWDLSEEKDANDFLNVNYDGNIEKLVSKYDFNETFVKKLTNYERLIQLPIEKFAEQRIKLKQVWGSDVYFGDYLGSCCSKEEAIDKEIKWLNAKEV